MRALESAMKAAADPTRTRILKLLEVGPLCVCQVQAVLGLAPSTISRHLSLLKAAGLVDDRRDGKWIEYRLAAGDHNPWAPKILELLRGPLDREPRILTDRRRLRDVRAVPLEQICRLPPARARAAPPAASRRRPVEGVTSRKGRRHG